MNMTTKTQPTPDELNAENALICEKLLGWERRSDGPSFLENYWRCATGGDRLTTPSFTTWAEAGLILEALQQPERWTATSTLTHLSQLLDEGHLTPAAVRTASLSYVRSRL